MDDHKKRGRYQRINEQLKEILVKTDDAQARMSTVIAVLHHKMDNFFWTGYYFLKKGKLIVGPYQGPVACQELKKDTGVCWTGINQRKTIVVPDVEKFPGHIACDSRSKSEIVLPLFDKSNILIGVLDIDSAHLENFNEVDAEELGKIIKLIFEV